MSNTITAQGVVLSAAPAGEYDKRVVLLTRELGKVTAFARGARKPGNMLMAVANPFVFGTFQLYAGRTSYTLQQASVSHHFTEISAELEGVYYGFYFLEIADYFGREGADEKEMLNLLYVSLKALLNPEIPNELVRCVFEFRTLVIQGEYPDCFHCIECGEGEKEPLTFFSEREQGMLCSACGTGRKDAAAVSPSLLYTLQYISVVSLSKLYQFQIKEEVLEELKSLVYRYFQRNTEKKFKSLDILKRMVQ